MIELVGGQMARRCILLFCGPWIVLNKDLKFAFGKNGINVWKWSSKLWINGWKHLTMTSFGVSHYTTIQECACLNISHLKFLKKFHNIFVYYVRIYFKQDIQKKISFISFYKGENWNIFVKKNAILMYSKTQICSKNDLNNL